MKIIFLISIIIISTNSKMIRDATNFLVIDTATNLMWQDDNYASINTRTWKEALDYCESLSKATFSDWKLPNINELESITDDSTFNPALHSSFRLYQSDKYWSSTTRKYNNNEEAWLIDFNNSKITTGNKLNYKFYTRCVRKY